MFSRSLFVVAIAVISMLIPASASAEVTVAGTGEPQFTSSSQNTQWVNWEAPSGSDAYRLRITYYRDSVQVTQQTLDVALSAQNQWINWSGVATLEEGREYEICVTGLFSLPNDSSFYSEAEDSCEQGDAVGKRTATTIDRSKPTISVQVAAGAAATQNTLLPLTITYADSHSAPFPANFLCVVAGSACNGGEIYGFSSSCSQPAAASKTTTFSCEVETSAISPPDGSLYVCATSADSAVPDNPNSANQTATANLANLSDKVCDSVVLDRSPPSAEIVTASNTVNRGESVSFSAKVSDAGSGLAPAPVRWIWNDGSPTSTGDSVAHTFTAPGTYTVEFEVADGAGNRTTASKVITVTDPNAIAPTDTGCELAKAKLAKAKAKLKALKQKGASKNRLKRAKMKAKSAKAAVTKACSG